MAPSVGQAGARAPLIEIFCSVQGEGRYVGRAMGFVRVATCPIRCVYCDTPHSYAAAPTFEVACDGASEGSPTVPTAEPNPVSAARAAALVDVVCSTSSWECGAPHRSPVSLTGGEPLVFPAFAAELGVRLREIGRALHLETAALDPSALAEVLPVLGHLSADWKLPGTLRTGDFRSQHERCVQLALAAGVSVDAKIVLTPAVRLADVEDAAARLSALRKLASSSAAGGDLRVVLQPVTPFGEVTQGLDPTALAELARPVVRAGLPYYVLPQTHKQLALP